MDRALVRLRLILQRRWGWWWESRWCDPVLIVSHPLRLITSCLQCVIGGRYLRVDVEAWTPISTLAERWGCHGYPGQDEGHPTAPHVNLERGGGEWLWITSVYLISRWRGTLKKLSDILEIGLFVFLQRVRWKDWYHSLCPHGKSKAAASSGLAHLASRLEMGGAPLKLNNFYFSQTRNGFVQIKLT